MYGIEIREFACRIAEVALWLMDHQMNQRLSEAFGQYFVRLPLKKSATIRNDNALRIDWKEVLPPGKCSFVMGNPPFVGGKFQTDEQRADMDIVAGKLKNAGVLDYVAAWYFRASEYIQGTTTTAAFVSTNSISQGEQVGVLWNELLRRGVRIRFAHRTFAWQSEAHGKAHVHVVIIGFGIGNAGGAERKLFDYENDANAPTMLAVKNISPYLVNGPDAVVLDRNKPLCDVPQANIGNKPIDDGNYLFLPEEKEAFVALEPRSAKWFRRWLGSAEFINGWERWCLWLGHCPPNELRGMPHALERVEAVRKFRLASKSSPTRKLASTPTRFHVENMPESNFIVIPKVSSERRRYIPIGFMAPDTLISDLCFIVTGVGVFHFGVLSSSMHMAWVRLVCGRLKSDFRYSAGLVYNNFPWPETTTSHQRAVVTAKAQSVLDARAVHMQPGVVSTPVRVHESSGGAAPSGRCSLADLYDPLTMPPNLTKAHAALDRAVDACYRAKPFESDREHVEFLFGLYEKLVAPLTAKAKTKRQRKKPD